MMPGTTSVSSPTALGERVRALRLRRGLSQQQAGGGRVSGSYVSLIESGLRVPRASVVQSIAEALGVSADELLAGVTSSEAAGRVELGLARSALVQRRFDAALALTQSAADPAPAGSRDDERFEALLIRARALAAKGAPVQAWAQLEALRAKAAAARAVYPLIPVLDAQSFAAWAAGDAGAAVAAGDALLSETTRLGLSPTFYADALFALCAAHWSQGRAAAARQALRHVVVPVEGRADALAAAAQAAQQRGAYGDARSLAELAVASSAGPEAGSAYVFLAAADRLLDQTRDCEVRARELLLPVVDAMPGACPVEQSHHARLALARCELAAGHPARARRLALPVARAAAAGRLIEAAAAHAVLADVCLVRGQTALATVNMADAARCLEQAPRSRHAAAAWVSLARLHERLNAPGAASTAYERAVASLGLTGAAAGLQRPA